MANVRITYREKVEELIKAAKTKLVEVYKVDPSAPWNILAHDNDVPPGVKDAYEILTTAVDYLQTLPDGPEIQH